MSASGTARVNGAAPASTEPAPQAKVVAAESVGSAESVDAADLAVSAAMPAGLSAVLAVLSSSAVVIDHADRVLQASEAARSFGLVQGDELVVGELLALARQVRRDGEIREGEIDISTGESPYRTTSFAVRIAPLGAEVGGGGLVLLLVEDQTERRRRPWVRQAFRRPDAPGGDQAHQPGPGHDHLVPHSGR